MKSLFSVGSSLVDDNNKYSKVIQAPQYLPSNVKPNIAELCVLTKYNKLMAEINKSDISEEDKHFLKLAATRHIVFNYSKIADYYAHSNKTVQELMEKSALVILDFDDAIVNGYVQLSETIDKIMRESGKNAAE